jgi:Zn-dependent peptidase ImmA (M78 family)
MIFNLFPIFNSSWPKILLTIIILFFVSYIAYLFYQERIQDTYDKYYDPKLDILKERLATVFPEIKNVDLSGSNKSFTVNKEDIYICMKDEKNNYYEDNMLIYVILHELAHVLCDEVGHTEKFKDIFRSLLKRAQQAGLYDPEQPPVDDYCNY